MKRIKLNEKQSVRRSLSMSSDSDSSYASFHSMDSKKSYGKWSKRTDLGPVIRTSTKTITKPQSDEVAVARKNAPTIKIKPIQRPSRDPDNCSSSTSSITPTQSEEVSVAQKRNYFDLTNQSREHALLPGLSFNALKVRHELFFTYDPRGSKDADDRYCRHCKCPKSYCCETVFGQVIKKQVLFFIEEIGGVSNDGVAGDSTFYNYQKIFSEEVHHKMLTNGIAVETGYNFHKLIRIPECMFQGSIKELIEECGKKKYMKFELGNPWVLQENRKLNRKNRK